ncbi:putative PPE family protein PPE29 [Mycobacterium basiliense]|uniref:Putative PPE family protein PPE29 n=1 Tax=Mycobacterium basiliense TaxID=2094119 RepID=A0A447GJD5_9MYCO|nr:PPE family protein [Mycobacterium basiliense]VDM90574.1 putative PPE family protein PPE29 [Mycobacterium basiliense]
MDFGALPPEINSARMYFGAQSEPLLVAAAAWDRLADDLYCTAGSYQEVLSTLAGDGWRGSASETMANAVAPYLSWLTGTAAQAELVANQARAAASAYENAFAASVPPDRVEANRARLTSLIAGNVISQDTPAITALEADYNEMWAQDAAAMYRYAAASAAAATLSPLPVPTLGNHRADVMSVGAQAFAPVLLAEAMSAVPEALRSLARPLSPARTLTKAMASLVRPGWMSSPVSGFAAAISSPLGMTESGPPGRTADSSQRTYPPVALAVGQGGSLGVLSVPRSWGLAAFGPVRSIA